MEKINFQDATLTTQAKVTIDGTDHEIIPAVYTGGTDLNASTFNTMQNNIESDIGTLSNLNTTEKTNLVGAINETNNKYNYSTEEQVIGTWIDGKPLYRKVVTGTTGTGTNLYVTFAKPTNIKSLKNAYGNYNNDTTSMIILSEAVLVSGNNIAIYFNNSNSTTFNYEIVLEYTKTTD